jgi:hypothetical protein
MLLTACSAPVAEGAQPHEQYPEYGRTPGEECRRVDFSRFIGQPATSAVAAEARDAAGAAIVRWLQPRQVVTMEYRADRLSISLDASNRVISLACG